MNNDADNAMLSEITNATSFIASIFLGTGTYDKFDAPTLSQARDVAVQMEEHYRNGRKALIYAQLPSGRQFLVPDNYKEV